MQTDPIKPINADIEALSSFVHELNITRRHLLTYPAGHPMIDDALEKVLALLTPLFELHNNLSIGVAKDALLFEQQWLPNNKPSVRDFANSLAQLDIAALHFRCKPDSSELIKLAELINSDRQLISEQGGISELIEKLQLKQIDITPVDYAAFQTTELNPQEQEDLANSLWENFLSALMSHSLLPNEGQTLKLADLGPKELAEILNRNYTLVSKDIESTPDQAIADFVRQLRATGEHKQTPGQQFHQLVEQLTPELRRQFLDSTFRHVDNNPVAAEETLQTFPSPLIDLAMQELDQNGLNVSTSMVNLLGKLSQHHDSAKGQVTSGKTKEIETAGDQIKTLFQEETEGKFTPKSYQSTLDTVVLQDHDFILDAEETSQLRQQLLNSSTERHNCAIIFNLLGNNSLQPEQCDAMQENLIDLTQFFLETGDFKGLTYLHQRLKQFSQKNQKIALGRTSKLQEKLNSPDFQQEILDNLSRWDEKKQQEIGNYIKNSGASIAESLVDRLASEEDQSLRRTYLSTLTSLGKSAHSAIYSELHDERWFLIRNLLTALRMQNDPIDIDKIKHLEKHPHLRVNQELLQLLFKFDRNRADKLLSKQLASTDPQLCLHAIQLAEQSQDPVIVQKLLTMLNTDKLTDTNLPLKKQLVKSLHGIGSEEALPTIEKLLKPNLFFTSPQKLELQKEAIRGLDKYPAQKVTPLLQKLVQSRNKRLNSLAAEKLRQLLRKQT